MTCVIYVTEVVYTELIKICQRTEKMHVKVQLHP